MCEKVTTWQLNKNVGHSQCCICGGQYGTDPDSYFTTVFKQKAQAERELKKVKNNYIKLLELFLKEDRNLTRKIKLKVKKLYNPNLIVEDDEYELQDRQKEESSFFGNGEGKGENDISRIY